MVKVYKVYTTQQVDGDFNKLNINYKLKLLVLASNYFNQIEIISHSCVVGCQHREYASCVLPFVSHIQTDILHKHALI